MLGSEHEAAVLPRTEGGQVSRYVIVGGGVAGTRAAQTIRGNVPAADIIILAREDRPFYRRPQLSEYAAGRLSEGALMARAPSFWREERVDLRLDTEVVGVEPGTSSVRLADGSSLRYDHLIIATGREPNHTGVGGSHLPGVMSFQTLGEAAQLRALQGGSGRVVVYGDSLPALQMVQAAAACGLRVTYLLAGERILPNVLDEDASRVVGGRLRAAGVTLVWSAVVRSIEEEGGRAAGVTVDGGEVYPADLVGACAVYTPATDMLPGGGSGFRVAEDLSTPWPHVWAAGDVVGDEPPFNWLRAWRQGERVGLAACGTRMSTGSGRSNVHVLNCQLMGLSVVAIGQTVVPYRSGPSEVRTEVIGEFYKKLVFAPDGRLIGALLVGNVAEAGELEEAVRIGSGKGDIDPGLMKQIFEPTYRPRFTGVQCPVCRHEIQLEPDVKAGDRVTCPICGVEFELVEGAQGLDVRAVE